LREAQSQVPLSARAQKLLCAHSAARTSARKRIPQSVNVQKNVLVIFSGRYQSLASGCQRRRRSSRKSSLPDCGFLYVIRLYEGASRRAAALRRPYTRSGQFGLAGNCGVQRKSAERTAGRTRCPRSLLSPKRRAASICPSSRLFEICPGVACANGSSGARFGTMLIAPPAPPNAVLRSAALYADDDVRLAKLVIEWKDVQSLRCDPGPAEAKFAVTRRPLHAEKRCHGVLILPQKSGRGSSRF
jgi:hypothetical protein